MLLLVVVSVLFAGIYGLPRISSEEVGVGPRIINGTEAKLKDFPYIVSLRISGKHKCGIHFCGGSIIHPEWILTAAHCIDILLPDQVVAGTLHISNSNGQRYKVVNVIPHEKFDRKTVVHDIGLIRVDRPITFSRLVKQIGLGKVGLGENVTTAGWGGGSGETLKYLPLQTTQCPEVKDPRMYICALAPNAGVFHGDSGGPVVKGQQLVGITSHGLRSKGGASRNPDMFTRVEAYQDWISSKIFKKQ